MISSQCAHQPGRVGHSHTHTYTHRIYPHTVMTAFELLTRLSQLQGISSIPGSGPTFRKVVLPLVAVLVQFWVSPMQVNILPLNYISTPDNLHSFLEKDGFCLNIILHSMRKTRFCERNICRQQSEEAEKQQHTDFANPRPSVCAQLGMKKDSDRPKSHPFRDHISVQ